MLAAVLCETHNRYRFFRRFLGQINDRKGKLIVLSNRLSIVLKARKDGLEARLVSGVDKRCGEFLEVDNFYEVQKKLLTSDEAEKLLSLTKNFISDFLRKNKPDYFFIWNGSSLVARVIAEELKMEGVATIFFEIGNFPKKLFVDPEGVNVRSWFARFYRDIDRSTVDMGKFHQWKEGYLETKKVSHTVQQAKTSMGFNWLYPVDLFGFWFLSSPYSERPDVFHRTWNFVKSRLTNYVFDEFSYSENGPYWFFPMQVSSDSQILWNSLVDNVSAIKKALELARKKGCVLVVKPHPAEINRVSVKQIEKLKDEHNFFFVNKNTFDLINKCEAVVTINSTVGMEAFLCSKPVISLGMAMYVDFTEEDMAYYLQEYLLDIDFFSNDPLTSKQFEAILERAKVGAGE